MSRKIRVPVAVGGSITPEMSPRARTQAMDDAWQQVGGLKKLVSWAAANDENYGKFLQLWAKGQLKAVMTEQAPNSRMEDALARLDAGEHAKVILGKVEHE